MNRIRNILGQAGIFWSLLWRGMVVGPVGFLMFVVVVALGMGLVVFPVLAWIFIDIGDWFAGAGWVALWACAVAMFCSKRLRRWFEEPPSLL